MTDEISQNAISAAASRMFATDELAAMSPKQLLNLAHRSAHHYHVTMGDIEEQCLWASFYKAQILWSLSIFGYSGENRAGGERGIRTLGTHTGSTVFETAPFNHSGTSPYKNFISLKTL